jgi:tetratricopeptide (TPR) repeat protein
VTGHEHPTALVSYSHDSAEHEKHVLDLCNRLRARGVDTVIDQFLPGAPSEGWPLWMERQIEQRDFTMMVCTETYQRRFMETEAVGIGRGVIWEARILRNLLYEDSAWHGRIIPVLFAPEARSFVPTVFRGNFYDLSDDRGFEGLMRHLLREPGAEVAALGPLGPQGSRWSAFERPWLVPDAMRTRYFTGRERLLDKIRMQLTEHHRAAVSGLGGSGKTQTAIEYAVRHRADYPDGVFWVNAENIGVITSGFVEIAKALRLSVASSNDQERIVQAVLEWFNGTGRWLLILDNVADRREIGPFVPQRGEGHVLLTSRETVFQELGIARAFDAGELDADEALRFLALRVGRDDMEASERAAAVDLARELGNLPLALEQAAAYIAENDASFEDYLRSFRTRRVALLERASGLVSRDTVAVTWAANFEAIGRDSPAAADVLSVSAFFAPEAIPFEIFERGASALGSSIAAALSDADAIATAELLRPLARYSLIKSDARSRTFSVHRLVQEIVRFGIEPGLRKTIIERGVSAIEAAFPETNYANWAKCEALVAHLFAIDEWLIADDVGGVPAARAFSKAGDYLNQRGRYGEAKKTLERALALGERAFGSGDPEIAATLGYMARVHENLALYPEAYALEERALKIREQALGPDDFTVGLSLNGMANAYVYQGRYVDAEPLYERSLAILARASESDSYVATALSNLGNIHLFQGHYEKAKPFYERSIAVAERSRGPDDPKVAPSLNNLGDVNLFLGHYREAEALYERALSIFEQALGPDHQYVAFSLVGLGRARAKLGRFDDAEPLFVRAVTVRERALGKDHPQTAISLTMLADHYLQVERFDDARPLFERARIIQERALGPDHYELAASLVGLAAIMTRNGKTAEAAALYKRALLIRKRTLDADHPEVAEIRQALDRLGVKHEEQG